MAIIGIGVGVPFRRNNDRWSSYWTQRCPEYMAVYNAWATKPSQAVATLQAEMIYTIVQAEAWDILDWFVCLANETETESRIDWKSLTKICADGGTGNVWSALAGIEGSGSGFLDTNFTPSTDGAHIGQNDVCYGFYTNLDIAAADQVELSGRTTAADGLAIYSKYTTGNALAKIHTTGSYVGAAVASRKGCFIFNRVTTNVLQIWKDGVKIYDDSASTNTAPPNNTIKLLSMPNGTSSRSLNQISFAFAGKGLTAPQIAAITSAIQAYMDGVFF